jgi:putative oxidoreductase
MPFLNRYSEQIFLVLRLVAGLMFAVHGLMKFGMFGGESMTGVPLMLAAAIIEAVGGLMIALGFFGDVGAFVNPIANHGESAVLYCFLFLYIAARGTGRYSIDRGMRHLGASR